MIFWESNVPSNSIHKEIQNTREKIKQLPLTEFSYYLTCLLACITNEENPDKYLLLVKKTDTVADALLSLYSKPSKAPNERAEELELVVNCLEELISAALPDCSNEIIDSISKLIGAFCGIISGVLFGLVGAVVGSIYGVTKPLSGGWICEPTLGFLSGFVLGFLVGYSFPSKLIYQEFTHKMDFCISSLERLAKELEDKKSHDEYKSETKKYILDTFYPNINESEREKAFSEFLKTNHQFQICTTTAGHITKRLKGFLGHHSLIRFKINGKIDLPIEFGSNIKTPNFVDQYESARTVTGNKLYEMLVLHKILKETHSTSFVDAIKIYEIGSNDCRNYIDKILIGTGQEPSRIGRFSKNTDKLPGYKLVRPLVSFFSRIKENEFDCFIENPDDEQYTVHAETWANWKDNGDEREQDNNWSGWNTP